MSHSFNYSTLRLVCRIPCSPILSFLGGQLSDALASRAGPSVKQECQSSPIHQSDYYRVTRSGNLSCKYIIHTLSPHHGGAIATILTTVLSFADTTLKLTSLALPAIGTGKKIGEMLSLLPARMFSCYVAKKHFT